VAPHVYPFIFVVENTCRQTAYIIRLFNTWLTIFERRPVVQQHESKPRISYSRYKVVKTSGRGIDLQCHQGVCGKDPAGDPGCLNVNLELTLGRGSFNVGSLASTLIAFWNEPFVDGLTIPLADLLRGTRPQSSSDDCDLANTQHGPTTGGRGRPGVAWHLLRGCRSSIASSPQRQCRASITLHHRLN